MSTTESAPDLERPLRADAARNRELILQTARKCFAERGLSVTLNDIAHEAGSASAPCTDASPTRTP
ncbi:TetR family transcriptional regulator [Curtobacterium sp. 24E2]|nr:TetR family transcriptional regulator [Curtobacterium sp. 24E2]